MFLNFYLWIYSEIKIRDDGGKEFYYGNKLHKTNGPAIELLNGYKAWYQHGLRHREDGPAVIWPDGEVEWFIEGKRKANVKNKNFFKIYN